MSNTKRIVSANGLSTLEISNCLARVLDEHGNECGRIAFGGECLHGAVSNSRTHVALALRTLLMTYTYLAQKSEQWSLGKPKASLPVPPTALFFHEPEDVRYPPLELVQISRENVVRVLWPDQA